MGSVPAEASAVKKHHQVTGLHFAGNFMILTISPDFYRISTFVPEINLQFNQFLVRDEQPLLFHTGMKGLFSAVIAHRPLPISPR